jgi:hypothetical protein
VKGGYRYVVHAYEDARQKRPIKHEHGGTTVLTDGAEALGRAELLAKEFPEGESTSTSSTEGGRNRQDHAARSRTLRLPAPPSLYSP